MEIKQYLSEIGLEVTSSAKDIKTQVANIRKHPEKFSTYLNKLSFKVTKASGEVSNTWDAADAFIDNHRAEIKETGHYEIEDSASGIAKLLEDIANEKEAYRQKRIKESAAQTPVTADYTQNIAKSKETVEIFNTVLKIVPNEYDKDLMHCFAIMGTDVVFRRTGKCYRLMTRSANGRTQIVFEAGDSVADGVISDITEAICTKFDRYMRRLQEKLAEVKEYVREDEEDLSKHPIEDIFLTEVPTIFRHIVEIRKTYNKKYDEESGKETKKFYQYRVYAKKSAVSELTADAFVEWIANNWTKATRNIIDKEDAFRVWSNHMNKLSLFHFVIWPEDTWRKAEMPESWKAVYGAKASQRLLNRLFFFIGSILDEHNTAQQYLAISDNGQTGKGLLIELLERIFENLTKSNPFIHLNGESFEDSSTFGLSSVRVWNYRIGVVDEYNGKSLNSNRAKSIIGGDTQTLDMKFNNAVKWETKQFRIIAPSNNGFVLRQHSLRRRCIPITFQATHSSIDNMNEDDKQKLIDDGEKFLMYCWRVYQESPLRQRDGGYFVCCPEDEEKYLNGEFYVDKGRVNPITGETILQPLHEDYNRYLRAFSKDEEIAQYYTVDDYDDTEITESYNTFIDKYCDDDMNNENYTMTVKHLSDLVGNYLQTDKILLSAFGDAVKTMKAGQNTITTLNYKSKDYATFKKYMENHGHPLKHTKEGNVFVGIRIKQEYMDDGEVKDPPFTFQPNNKVGNAYTSYINTKKANIIDFESAPETYSNF